MTDRPLDSTPLIALLSQARAEAFFPISPEAADSVGDAVAAQESERPIGVGGEMVVFSAPPPPSFAARVLAWSLLAVTLASVGWVTFLL